MKNLPILQIFCFGFVFLIIAVWLAEAYVTDDTEDILRVIPPLLIAGVALRAIAVFGNKS